MDKLIQAIKEKNNPTVCGLDPILANIPSYLIKGNSCEKIAEGILEFNKQLIDAIYDIVPAVKPQSAYYELYGYQGVRALEQTVKYAKSKGLYVIMDGKRNDIGSTATAYAQAYLGEDFGADAITVNGYLGIDGVKPFIDMGKDIFVLVKTSNPSSGELQDLTLQDGSAIYEKMGELCEQWGADTVGENGYSRVGAVVGATYPQQLATLREQMPHTFFLVPGYGAQGGTADDIAHAFDSNGLGAIINASRSIMCAYKKEEGCSEENFAEASRREAMRMRGEITR